MQPTHTHSVERVLESCNTLQHLPDGTTNKYWKDQRGVVTASQLPAIMDVFGEERRMQLWYEAIDPHNHYFPPEKSFVTFLKNRGVHFEPVARQAFETITGKKVTEVGSVAHEEFPWFTASPDGIIEDEGALVEIKWSFHPFDPKVIKEEHYLQIQAQLEVCNLEKAYLVRYCQDGYLHWAVVERDRKYFNNCWTWIFQWKNKILSFKELNQR